MWRIFSTIPRAVRQQFNSSVRHSGACIDEDAKNKHGTKTENQSQLVSFSTSHNNWQQDVEADQEKQEEWRKSHYHDKFGSAFGQNTLLEAIRWGAAVAAGIHLTKPIFCRQAEKDRNRNSSVLQEILIHFPRQRSVSAGRESVLPWTSGKKHHVPEPVNDGLFEKSSVQGKFDQGSQQKVPGASWEAESEKEVDLFDLAMKQFHDLCQNYNGVNENLMALSYVKRQDYSEAVHHWKLASKAGYSKAYFNLGLCHEQGLGTSQDLRQAESCYRSAAARGHTQAMYNLAVLLVKKNNDQVESCELLEKAAEGGLKRAQTELAIHYLETQGKPKNKAGTMLESAADRGRSRDQYYLAICYENGWGVPRSEFKAAELYGIASKLGHVEAKYFLGTYYEHGLGGLPEDASTAKILYQESAKSGHVKAKERLDKLLKREAVNRWTELYEKNHSRRRLKRSKTHRKVFKSTTDKNDVHLSASSPTLTNFLQQQISELHISNQRTISASSIPQFYIGEELNGTHDKERVIAINNLDRSLDSLDKSRGLRHSSSMSSIDGILCK